MDSSGGAASRRAKAALHGVFGTVIGLPFALEGVLLGILLLRMGPRVAAHAAVRGVVRRRQPRGLSRREPALFRERHEGGHRDAHRGEDHASETRPSALPRTEGYPCQAARNAITALCYSQRPPPKSFLPHISSATRPLFRWWTVHAIVVPSPHWMFTASPCTLYLPMLDDSFWLPV